MTAAMWIVIAALTVAVLVWRLRKANQTLSTILREERERPADVDATEQTPHHLGKNSPN